MQNDAIWPIYAAYIYLFWTMRQKRRATPAKEKFLPPASVAILFRIHHGEDAHDAVLAHGLLLRHGLELGEMVQEKCSHLRD